MKQSIIDKPKRDISKLPILVLTTQDRFKEQLKMYIKKDFVVFSAGIDGVGQTWVIPKDYLKKVLQ